MQLTVTHTLNVRFINLATPQSVTIMRDGVAVQVAASVVDGNAFGSIVCSGITEIPIQPTSASSASSRSSQRARHGSPVILVRDRAEVAGPEVTAAVERVEDALQAVGRLIRWRFNVAGEEAALGTMELRLETEDGLIDLHPVPGAYFGDDQSTIAEGGLEELNDLALQDDEEPLAHQLLREAWDLRYSNPRSSVVIGVSAAEVGLAADC